MIYNCRYNIQILYIIHLLKFSSKMSIILQLNHSLMRENIFYSQLFNYVRSSPFSQQSSKVACSNKFYHCRFLDYCSNFSRILWEVWRNSHETQQFDLKIYPKLPTKLVVTAILENFSTVKKSLLTAVKLCFMSIWSKF